MKYLIIFQLLIINHCQAQVKSTIGFGAGGGFKTAFGTGGFILEYQFQKRISLYLGSSYGKFSGYGYVTGLDIFITRNDFQPFIGLSFNKQSGDRFYVGENNVDRTDYRVLKNEKFIGTLGFRKFLYSDVNKDNSCLCISPFISYQYSPLSHKVIYISGVINQQREDKMNNRLSNGLGFGIKIIQFFGRNED